MKQLVENRNLKNSSEKQKFTCPARARKYVYRKRYEKHVEICEKPIQLPKFEDREARVKLFIKKILKSVLLKLVTY